MHLQYNSLLCYVHVSNSRRKVEEGVKKLSAAHEKMEEKVEQLAQQLGVNAGDETTVANMVKEETDKVEWVDVAWQLSV